MIVRTSVWLLLLAACEPDPVDMPGDAGPPPSALAAPEPAAPPRLLPCPDGWRELAGEPPACDPWPESGPATCADGEAHFVGEPGCAPVGAPCPDGDWPEDLPLAGVVYVRAGAPSGGDGSRESPLSTISEAVATDAEVVALSAGTFEEAVLLTRPVTLRGACAARTRIVLTASAASWALRAVGPSIEVHDLAIAGTSGGMLVGDGSTATSLEVSGIEVDGVATAGVYVLDRASLAARGLVVRDTDAPVTELGFGLAAAPGSSVSIERAVFAENGDVGVVLFGSEAVLRSVSIRGTRALPDQTKGYGLEVGQGATLTLSNAAIEDNTALAVRVNGEGTEASLDHFVIRRTVGGARGDGRAILVANGAAVRAARGLMAGNIGIAMQLETGGRLEAEDVIVRDPTPNVMDGVGGGFAVAEGSTGTLRRGRFEGNATFALLSSGAGSVADVSDVIVEGTRSSTVSGEAYAILGDEGGELTGSRLELRDNEMLSIAVLRAGHATLRNVASSGTLSASSAAIPDGRGRGGVALAAVASGSVDVERASFEGNRTSGVVAATGGVIQGRDIVVRDTVEQECGSTGCNGLGGGFGLAAEGAAIELRRFLIAESQVAGVVVSAGAEVDLHEGEVARNALGAAISEASYDVSRLQDDVRFLENGQNLQHDGSLSLGGVIPSIR